MGSRNVHDPSKPRALSIRECGKESTAAKKTGRGIREPLDDRFDVLTLQDWMKCFYDFPSTVITVNVKNKLILTL